MNHVHIAVYHARKQGKTHLIYNPNMEEEFKTNRIVMNELKCAIENNALEVYYQPTVELASAKIIGVEALVRLSMKNQD